MHIIDKETWPRRRHFELFNGFDYPHFNLCGPVEITRFLPQVKATGTPFTSAVMYVLARAANEQAGFRQRIRGDQVVEHDTVDPAPTLLTEGDLFSYYSFSYTQDFPTFAANAQAAAERTRRDPTLHDEPGRDDYLFMTSIPWVSFTSITHPIHMHPADSVPRLSWGKFYREGEQVRLPVSVQVSHALLDGIHVGRYFERVQALLDQLDWLL